MLQIALCDDDAEHLTQLRTMVETYVGMRNNLDVEILSCRSPQSLLKRAKTGGGFDLYILDVIMPEKDGIQLGLELRQLDSESVLIYITTSPDFALDSYMARAFQYLIKPVPEEKLFSVLDEAIIRMEAGRAANLTIKTKDGLTRLPLRSLTYAELAGRRVCYYPERGEPVEGGALRGSFREAIAPLLEDARFIMCGSSFVVNLQHVQTVEHSDAILTDGRRVPISRQRYHDVKMRWMDYWLGTNEHI